MIPLLAIARRLRLDRVPRAIGLFFATSLAARGLGIGCQLLQVPIVIGALGGESFGVWMTLTGAASLLLFADLGMGLCAQNRMAEHFARGEAAEARTLLGSLFLALSGIGVLAGAAAALVLSRLDLTALLHLRNATTASGAPAAALAFAWILFAGLPFGLAQRLAFACQAGWHVNASQAAGSVLSLVLVAAGAAAGWGLAGLVAAAQVSQLLANAALLAVQLTRLGWWRGWCLRPRLAPLRGLAAVGACFTVQQLLATVLFALPPIVISVSLGAAAVTPYNLVQRLFNLFAVVQNGFMVPLWPAYSRAKARCEFDWMRAALRRSLQATALCSVLPMVLAAGFVPTLVGLWVGPSVPPPDPAFVWLLCTWNALVFLQQPFSYLLAGVSEVRRTTMHSALGAAASILLMLALVRPGGASGVVLGLVLGYLPFSFRGNVVEARRYLRVPAAAAAGPAPALST